MSTVDSHLAALMKKGWVELKPGAARYIRLLREDLPVVVAGPIAAGEPLLAEGRATARLPRSARERFRPPPDCFLEVRGDSMDRLGIRTGTVVAVKAQAVADNGEVVVARLGDAVTLERFVRLSERRVERRPESTNPAHRTLALVLEATALHIDGVAVGALIGRGFSPATAEPAPRAAPAGPPLPTRRRGLARPPKTARSHAPPRGGPRIGRAEPQRPASTDHTPCDGPTPRGRIRVGEWEGLQVPATCWRTREEHRPFTQRAQGTGSFHPVIAFRRSPLTLHSAGRLGPGNRVAGSRASTHHSPRGRVAFLPRCTRLFLVAVSACGPSTSPSSWRISVPSPRSAFRSVRPTNAAEARIGPTPRASRHLAHRPVSVRARSIRTRGVPWLFERPRSPLADSASRAVCSRVPPVHEAREPRHRGFGVLAVEPAPAPSSPFTGRGPTRPNPSAGPVPT